MKTNLIAGAMYYRRRVTSAKSLIIELLRIRFRSDRSIIYMIKGACDLTNNLLELRFNPLTSEAREVRNIQKLSLKN